MNEETPYVYVLYDPHTQQATLRTVSQKRKRAIDSFVSWASGQYRTRNEEETFAIDWIRTYVDSKAKNSCQWANVIGKHGVRMMIETILGHRLIQAPSARRIKCDWYDYKRDYFYEVMSRPWSNPGSIGHKCFGVAYSLLGCNRPVDLICIGYQNEEAEKKLALFRSKHSAQQEVIDLFHEHRIRFVSQTALMRQLNYE